jgi:glycolate oxidase iron-sulfur subunit
MHAPLNEIDRKPAVELDPRTYRRALSCVHCGLCLSACPTYTTNQHEADSPRGRIQLMRGLADGLIEPTESVTKHLELCLDCRACETACPSGVVYHELIEETRARLADRKKLSFQERLMRGIFFHVFVHRNRLRWALVPPRLMQKIGFYGFLRKTGIFRLLPVQLRKMEQMLPAEGRIWPRELPVRIAARGEKKATVGFFAGCIGSVMFDEVNRKAAELLSACGAEVITPPAQVCCGAIHHHNGIEDPAREFARRNIDVFVPENGPAVDYIVTDIAGCGAALREYDLLLRDDRKYAERAKVFAGKVRDVTEVLAALGLPEMKHLVNVTVTYHDACHLAHAQKVTNQPRALLSKVPGLNLVALPESDMCCGAAGTYNLTQPEMSMKLAERKLDAIATTGAEVCATGIVGCAMQIQSTAAARGRRLTVVHPVEILHRAVFGVQG